MECRIDPRMSATGIADDRLSRMPFSACPLLAQHSLRQSVRTTSQGLMEHVTFILVTSGLLQKESFGIGKIQSFRQTGNAVLLMEEPGLLATGIALTFYSIH